MKVQRTRRKLNSLDLPLFQWEALHVPLTLEDPTQKHVARQYGLRPATARLFCELAGIGRRRHG